MPYASSRAVSCGAALTVLLAAAACQGNIGTGGGLPQPPGPQVTAGPVAGSQSRTRTTEGAVYLEKETKEIPFPDVNGFALTLMLVEPTPSPSPSGSPAARSTASVAPTASPSPTPSPLRVGMRAGATAKPAATPSGPKIDIKTTTYPDDVPAVPTPQPTGNVQVFAKRVPLVKGSLMSHIEIKLYSLAAARFKIPADEQVKNRGYTIALYESLKKRKTKTIAWDPNATPAGHEIGVEKANDPIRLRKNVGYFFVLYGDDIAPPPTPRSSFPPATNPVLGSPGPANPLAPTPFPTLTPLPALTPAIRW